VPLPAGCESKFTDAACGGCLPANPGKGVTFILGGSTILDIHGGATELFSPVPGTMDAAATPYTTIFAMASASPPAGEITGAAYKTHNPDLTNDRCNCAFVSDNSGQQIIFHGLTYSPYSPVDVFNNAGVNYSPFYGGIVSNEIVARVDSGSASGLFAGQFAALGGPVPRTVRITATAPGANGSVNVISTAVVEIDQDPPVIDSWRSDCTRLPNDCPT